MSSGVYSLSAYALLIRSLANNSLLSYSGGTCLRFLKPADRLFIAPEDERFERAYSLLILKHFEVVGVYFDYVNGLRWFSILPIIYRYTAFMILA